MNRILAVFLILVAFGAGVGAGILGILYATGGTGTPSRDVAEVAPTLSLDSPTATPGAEAQLATQVAGLNTKVDGLATQIAVSNERLFAQIDSIGAVEVEAQAADDAPADDSNDSKAESAEDATEEAVAMPEIERALFRITEEGNEARFFIDEVFLGNEKTVIGTTRRVAGDIIINYTDPSQSQVGTIAVNARTFRTDNQFRDQSIRGQILETAEDEFEFITFTPSELINAPVEPVSVGDTVDFQIVGDLFIRGETNEVIFDASIAATALDRIEGFATTEVLYADYGITINAPQEVTGIGDSVILEIDFIAELIEDE